MVGLHKEFVRILICLLKIKKIGCLIAMERAFFHEDLRIEYIMIMKKENSWIVGLVMTFSEFIVIISAAAVRAIFNEACMIRFF